MTRTYLVSLHVLLPVWAVSAALPALAADGRCARLAIEADAGVEAGWPGLTGRVHEAFDARLDTDGCARVRLSAQQAAIDLEVVLPDGRSARRSQLQADDLLPALEALLVLPEPLIDQPPLTASSVPVVEPAPREPPPPPAPPRSAEPARTAFEFSIATGARVGDGQLGVGFGIGSLLELEGWLIGLHARLDGYQWTDGGSLTPALEFAAVGGYRFAFDGYALSLYAGPAWARLQTSVTDSVAVGTLAPEPDEPEEPFTARLCLGARIDLATRSVLRTFIGIDGVIGPPGDSAERGPDAVRQLPAWTLGVVVGATLGTT